MGERMRRAGQMAWALVGLAVLVVLVGVVAWTVRVVFPPLVLAGAIVFVLHPVVTWLQIRRVPRVLGTTLAYVGVLGLLVLGAALVHPLVVDQADELADEWPGIERDLAEVVDNLAARSESWPISVPTYDEISEELAGNGDDASIGDTVEQVRDVGGRIFHVLLIFVLGPILAFYLLVDLPRLGRVTRALLPASAEDEVLHVARRLSRSIGGFFRGQLLVALTVGTLASLALLIAGLDFWLLVGMIAGITNVVPLIGPWVGGVPGVIIALTTHDVQTAVIVVLIMVGVQQIDNHLISPMVMRRTVSLHPAAVLLALFVGGTLGGFFGLLLAVPVAAVLKVLVGHLWRTYVLGEPWQVAITAAEAAEGPGVVEDVIDL